MSKHILLAVTGGIAAYKACEIVRLLKKQGHTVTVAMSEAACNFITPQTMQALSGNPVLTQNGGAGNGMTHIQATRAADIMLIAPASANTIAKIAHGFADNLITEMAAARKCPLAIAPAMNVEMWNNPANLRNIQQLQRDGIHILFPAVGEQACGETGIGRMREAEEIAELLPDFWSPKPLYGKKVLLTMGACYEAIDPVRGITNRSSGQMGAALARACRMAGAEVYIVHAHMQAALPVGIRHIHAVESAKEMYDAVMQHVETGMDAFISVAAVADYRAAQVSRQKLKKGQCSAAPVIKLTENPDILRSVAMLPNAPFCVGFAAESENVLANARTKRQKKHVPLMVANDVAVAMGQNSNQLILLDDEQERTLPQMSKEQAAKYIVVRMITLMRARTAKAAAAKPKAPNETGKPAEKKQP